MKTMSIRDLRQRWPEAEAALGLEEEILITRDSKPVARLVRVTESSRARRRWDVKAHARWQKKVAGANRYDSGAALEASRQERNL